MVSLSLFWKGLKDLAAVGQLDWFPFRHQLKGYRLEDGWADARAGLAVALLAVPQGMAYAMIAGLDEIYFGIMCSAVAGLVGPLFASSRLTVLGPTNATAFMIYSTIGASMMTNKIAALPMLVLMVGVLLTVGALFRLAELVQYVSRSVVVGYITGAAVLIIANQLRHVFGIDNVVSAVQTGFVAERSLVGILWNVFSQIGSTQWQPLVLGGVTLLLFVILYRYIRSFAFVIALVVGTVLWKILNASAGWNVQVVGGFDASAIQLHFPELNGPQLFADIRSLMGLAIAIAFLAAIEQSVMSKTLATKTGRHPDVNQDMLSLGVTNLVGSFTAAMPASGSITRSALNSASGARTGVSSLICGGLCLLAVFFLGPLAGEIPKCCLAALVIGVAMSVISIRNLRTCLAATASDAIVVVLTFMATLFLSLDVAIFVGVALSVALYLKKASRPYLAEYEFNPEGALTEVDDTNKRQNPQISIVHVEGDLFFGAAELFRTQIQRVCRDPQLKVIILRMRNARHLDATSVMALEDLIKFLRTDDRHLIISGATPDVVRVLRNSGLLKVLDDDLPQWQTGEKDRNLFLNDARNPNLSTRDALRRAQEIVGKDAEVRIFYDPQHDKS